jgi:hypothetical protein
MIPGLVAYRGPSRLDGTSPILLAISYETTNYKTGDMAQAWVLRSDVPPTYAIRSGADRAICGDCVHRSGSEIGRSCYVIPWLGPLKVYDAIARRSYMDIDPDGAARALAGRQLRITAYGDPAAVPFYVWRTLMVHLAGWTGYTHQWRTCDQRFSSILMASVESAGEVLEAQALGWRTFRTRLGSEDPLPNEIVCPASNEAGHRTTCSACGLCRGRARGNARSIVIAAHGNRVAFFRDLKATVEATHANA